MADWDDLRFLLALHQAGSLARAGSLLGVDKATVGRRVESLESTLQAQLVERLPGGYHLTDAGRRALDAAQAMASVMAELDGELGRPNRQAVGAVRVTAPAWFCRHVLIPALPEFRTAHQGIELQLLTTNVVVSMTRREADIAVRNLRAAERGLASRRLGDLASRLYGARRLLDRVGRPERRELIASLHLVSYQERVSYVPDFAWLEALGAPIAFRASDTLALAEACAAGLGLAVLPCAVGDADETLEPVACAGLATEPIWMIVPQDLRQRLAVRLTMQWIATRWEGHMPPLSGTPPSGPP